MARMHSGAKGKSGSTKPFDKTAPKWISYKPAEVEALVVKMAKNKSTASQIGLTLRDQYGIPDVKALVGKKITQILKEKEMTKSLPQDMLDLISRAVQLIKHLENNKQDKPARRGLTLTESKIRRLVSYYKETGVLEQTFRYDNRNPGVYLE